jgi:cell wall-associated NlpC family hydrolase
MGAARLGPRGRTRHAVRCLAGVLLAIVTLLAMAPASGADEITDARAQAQAIAEKIDQLDGKMMEYDNQYSLAQAALEKANADIGVAQGQVSDTQQKLDQIKVQVRAIALQAYVDGNDSPTFDALLTTTGDHAPQKVAYSEATSGNRQDAIDDMRATKAALADQIDTLNQAKADAQAQTDKLGQAKADSEAALQQQQALKQGIDSHLADLVQQQEAQIAAARAAQLAEQAAQQAAQAQAAAAAQAADARQASVKTTTAPAPDAAPAPTVAPTTAPPATSPPATSRSTTTSPGNTGMPDPKPGGPTTTVPSAPAPPSSPGNGLPAPKPGAAAAVAAAYSALGVPYVYGGASMSGFDCSGLTSWAWAHGGVSLARTSEGQFSGVHVPLSALLPGDLVFYNGLGHVGIYVGGGMIIHAPHTGTVVRMDSVYFWGPIDGAIRP